MTREPKVAVRYPLAPRRARAYAATGTGDEKLDAWFYIDDKGLDIYCHAAPGVISAVRVTWRQVEAALALRGPLPQLAEIVRLRKALEDALEIIRSVNDPTQASAGLRQIVEAALRPDEKEKGK